MASAAKVSSSGAQHVDIYRKVLLRKRLLKYAEAGAAYVPFIGDGDLAVELYDDRRVYGADLDTDRVKVARSRLSNCEVRVADCDVWTFPGLKDQIAVADFDAYSDPYAGFRDFWAKAPTTDRLVLFFTDGHKQGLMRTGHWHLADGSYRYLQKNEKAAVFNFYLSKHINPWFESFIHPWKVVHRFRYLRGMMLYWGVVIDAP